MVLVMFAAVESAKHMNAVVPLIVPQTLMVMFAMQAQTRVYAPQKVIVH